MPTGFWRLHRYSGELKLNGFYREQQRNGYRFSEKQQTTNYMAGLALRTQSYFWHPRFITLDVDAEYTPARSDEKFLVIPDQAETRDVRKADIRLTILPQHKYSLVSYLNYSRVYNNRENLSNIRSSGTNWGSTLFMRSKFIPFSLGYTSWDQQEDELLTGRSFLNRQKNVEARFNKSFGSLDKQELLLSRNYFFRRDYSRFAVSNTIYNANYSGLFFTGKAKKNTISNYMSGNWQRGNEPFDRYQAISNMNWDLHHGFHFNNHYTYFGENRFSQRLDQHKAGAALQHQLFQSLHTRISYEYTTTAQTTYSQQLSRGAGEFNYSKIILKKHQLDLNGSYALQQEKWKSADAMVTVLNEAITLRDGLVTLLSRAYADAASIQLKDGTGTLYYQLNLDYIIIPQGNFIQVQRVPGGLIPDNTTVYADYTAMQPGNFSYYSTNSQVGAGLYFFNRLIGVYYRRAVQDYQQLKQAGFLTLNYFHQKVAGIRADYKWLSAGVEYDKMNSTVLPYELFRYYLQLQGSIKDKCILSASGNIYHYTMLNDIPDVRFTDITAAIMFRFTKKVSLSTSIACREQTGQGLNLNMLNSRTELSANLHKLRFGVIYNYYDRILSAERIKFNAVTVQCLRRF
ncbi:MAG: hypothetical protein HZA79_03010 [Sphingobacteriales bacterium]|nr:hypothetical protein [Sphingobacteriales bacterium]